MQLTGPSVIERNVLTNHDVAHARPASYDLSVQAVFAQGAKMDEPAVIMPQQIVIIVSKETIHVPAGCVGYAMPKTSLCNRGIHVFNTGLVDPGYNGRLSTIAINFSRTPIQLAKGQEFLRFVLHELQGPKQDAVDPTLHVGPRDEDLALRSLAYPSTFLDVPGQTDRLIREVTNDVVDRQRNAMVLIISAVGFLFVLWNFGSYFLLSRQANVVADHVIQSEAREVGALDERTKLQGVELQRLQGLVDSLRKH